MTRTMSATEARVHFGEVLDRVESQGVRIVVERAGKPVGVIIPMSDLERLERSAFDPQDAIAQARALRERIAEHRRGEPLPDAAEEIRAMREDRDAELLGGML